ncbi:hypothetical protein [Micromonospora sp. ATCC 39149]|uniref:Uncharacterized protein n=1 Tax=Micromonospora carbonacea TaxID=47853 RepID=A0A7D6GQW4_9ACTN|nr:hypothetical protein [Micromonospora sp. ATCC 39149]QLK00691.1 hypothetical protein HZU44_12195 [Micromonospora carbonacea]
MHGNRSPVAGPARRLRQRATLTAGQLAGLELGDEVVALTHPVHPVVRLTGPS